MRRIDSLLILTAFGVVMCGCTPDKGSAVPNANAVNTPASATMQSAGVPAEKDARPVIVCFGDSITAGLGLDPDQSYPADMQRDFDAAGLRYRVVNMGVSGETTKDGLARVGRVLALKPEWVVVEFGGNDGLRGLPLSETQSTLANIVTALRQGGTKVLLAGISLPPQYGPDYVNRFNAMFPAVAKQTGAPLYPFIYKDVFGVAGDIQDDGVHPTSQGAIQVAKNIGGALMPLLKK